MWIRFLFFLGWIQLVLVQSNLNPKFVPLTKSKSKASHCCTETNTLVFAFCLSFLKFNSSSKPADWHLLSIAFPSSSWCYQEVVPWEEKFLKAVTLSFYHFSVLNISSLSDRSVILPSSLFAMSYLPYRVTHSLTSLPTRPRLKWSLISFLAFSGDSALSSPSVLITSSIARRRTWALDAHVSWQRLRTPRVPRSFSSRTTQSCPALSSPRLTL